MLDPRISKSGLLCDAEDDNDEEYKKQILESCESLQTYYKKNYVDILSHSSGATSIQPQATSREPETVIDPITRSPHKHDYMARYARKNRTRYYPLPNSELADYFVTTPIPEWEPGTTFDPLRWWKQQSQRFPHLSRLARDILSIPGMLPSVSDFFWA